MTSVRVILAALLAAGLAVLAVLNWQDVTIRLGGNRFLDIKLPLFVAAIVALVALPMGILGYAQRALLERRIGRLSRQLEKAEADLAQARIELLRPPAPASTPPAPADTPGPPAPGLPPPSFPQAAPPPGA